jgi:hypothetical protein
MEEDPIKEAKLSQCIFFLSTRLEPETLLKETSSGVADILIKEYSDDTGLNHHCSSEILL